jgi:hypothetical protein
MWFVYFADILCYPAIPYTDRNNSKMNPVMEKLIQQDSFTLVPYILC